MRGWPERSNADSVPGYEWVCQKRRMDTWGQKCTWNECVVCKRGTFSLSTDIHVAGCIGRIERETLHALIQHLPGPSGGGCSSSCNAVQDRQVLSLREETWGQAEPHTALK